MKTNNQMSLTIDIHSIAAIVLALALALFTTASAGDVIATGTIDFTNLSSASPGQQASFLALSQICTSSLAQASLACSLTGGGIFPEAAINNSLQLQQFSPQAAMQAESIAITSPYQFIR
ncbi:MAG: hypothetical protein WAW61_16600, partial [Methylococcaceae bacterium]